MSDDKVKSMTDEEIEVSFSGAAIASNRFFIHVGPLVRISFAEQANDTVGPQFRTAVALAYQDAIQLHRVLGRMLEPIEVAMKEQVVPKEGHGGK